MLGFDTGHLLILVRLFTLPAGYEDLEYYKTELVGRSVYSKLSRAVHFTGERVEIEKIKRSMF